MAKKTPSHTFNDVLALRAPGARDAQGVAEARAMLESSSAA